MVAHIVRECYDLRFNTYSRYLPNDCLERKLDTKAPQQYTKLLLLYGWGYRKLRERSGGLLCWERSISFEKLDSHPFFLMLLPSACNFQRYCANHDW